MTCGRSVVFSTNKSDRHDITEILLKVAINTIIPFRNDIVPWSYAGADPGFCVRGGLKSVGGLGTAEGL